MSGIWRRRRIWVVVAVIIVTLGVLNAPGNELTEPFASDSTEPDGTKALALLTQELGARFEIKAVPDDPAGTAVLFIDTLSVTETRQTEEWIRRGGTLVVTDRDSSFAEGVLPRVSDTLPPGELQPRCESDLVSGVGEIRPQSARQYSFLEASPNAAVEARCFSGPGGSSFLVSLRQGLGRVVVLGSSQIFTNRELGKVDNSVLVANLLDPRLGTSVTYLRTEDAGEGKGDEGLADLIPDGVRNGLWQLVIAGLVLIVWRWRRLGDPVVETSPVELPGSSLVVAVGDLMQTAGREQRAAELMRTDLRRMIVGRLGLPPDIDLDVLIEVTAQRTGTDAGRIREALTKSTVVDGRALVELAQEIESTYQEVTHGR